MILDEGGAAVEASLADRLDEVLAMAGPDLLSRVGEGHMSPAAYDTGWVARIADPSGSPEFPEALDWLVANQREDGSWGSEVFHEYDRFINTLSAAIALRQWGHAPEAVAKAESFLTSRISMLGEACEGVSSDHVVALLMNEAKGVGLDLPYDESPHERMGAVKRAFLAVAVIDKEHPLGFFSEILGRVPNQRRLARKLQLEDGSIMSSASATAASIVFDSDPRPDHSYYDKLRYLRRSMVDGGGVKHFWNLDTMEAAYTLYNLLHAGVRSEGYMALVSRLEEAWTTYGLGFSKLFPVTDMDDTAFGYRVLADAGKEPDWHVFDAYFHDDHFVTYRVETRGRPGPNIHAIEALAHSSHPDKEAMIEPTIGWLKRQMVDGRSFVDEWHLSPAYCTAHAIPAFHLTDEALMGRCASFFLDSQHQDGSWGFVCGKGQEKEGTVEETAYALQGLLYYHHYAEPVDEMVLRRGAEYIVDNYPTAAFPDMWMAKVLNTPRCIVDSLVLSSLIMYKRFAGGDLSVSL